MGTINMPAVIGSYAEGNITTWAEFTAAITPQQKKDTPDESNKFECKSFEAAIASSEATLFTNVQNIVFNSNSGVDIGLTGAAADACLVGCAIIVKKAEKEVLEEKDNILERVAVGLKVVGATLELI